MICLDSDRNIIKDDRYIRNGLEDREFIIVDDWKTGEYHFEGYDSPKLIYLGEHDLVYSIADLKKGILVIAPKRNGEDTCSWITGPLLNVIEIPMLERLLKNKRITKTNAPLKVKERDGNCCQLCGETDIRTLNVHHIVPRKSPFVIDSFIHSPLNQITLCANCHRIEHHVLEHGSEAEREEHVRRMFDINGLNYGGKLGEHFYESMDVIKRYNQIEFIY